jgi:hypothetical protein
VKITILVEGDTERVFLPPLRDFLSRHLAGGKMPSLPEQVNHSRPPAARIKEIFERGKCRDSYVKPRDALRILKDNDLSVSIEACAELKAFVNTIIRLSGGQILP